MYVRFGVYACVCERECVRVGFLGHVCACVSVRFGGILCVRT